MTHKTILLTRLLCECWPANLNGSPVLRSVSALYYVVFNATQGGVVSITSAHCCLDLGTAEQQQLAVLIANMIEDHFRAASSTSSYSTSCHSNQQETHHDHQGDTTAPRKDSLHLHSPVEHGASPTSPREYGTTICVQEQSEDTGVAGKSYSSLGW